MNVSSLASAIVNYRAAASAAAVQYAVAAKALESEQFQGEAAVKLIQAAQQTLNQATAETAQVISHELDLLA